MSRAKNVSTARSLTVWIAMTAGTGGCTWVARGSIAPLLEGGTPPVTFHELLVQVSSVALLGASAWLWVVTSSTVWGCLRGRVPNPSTRARRLVLALCGAAVGAGMIAPAAAHQGSDNGISGLRLPDRVHVAPMPAPEDGAAARRHTPGPTDKARDPAPRTSPTLRTPEDQVHVVAPGDSLWVIAKGTSPPDADLDRVWRSIWTANREVIGHDPDLIRPGQRLRLPRTDTTPPATSNTSEENAR